MLLKRPILTLNTEFSPKVSVKIYLMHFVIHQSDFTIKLHTFYYNYTTVRIYTKSYFVILIYTHYINVQLILNR